MEKVNVTMNEITKEGREIVCVAQEHPSKIGYAITFCRESKRYYMSSCATQLFSEYK